MKTMLRVAAVAIPAALATVAPIQNANANPMVAVGWLWAAGLGGLGLGFLGGHAYASQNPAVVVPVEAAPPVSHHCRMARIGVDGRWRQAEICE